MKIKLKILAGVLLLLATAVAQAKQSPVRPVERLSKVGVFAFGGIGFAGITSEGEKDFRTILASSSALSQFEQLFATGNLQAKAYALVGIRRLDLARYNELSAPLQEIPQRVTIFQGCVMSHVPFSSLLKSIGVGNYDAKK